jgi:aryl-phospho-beta-D-glucosidase BglC (GH1 family)
MKVKIVGLVLTIVATVSFGGSAEDFAGSLAQNDLVWDAMATDFYTGAFIGDGIQGAMILRDDQNENGIRMLMGHYKAITHYTISKWEYCQSRVFAGEIIIHPKGKPVSESMRLSLWDGQVNGTTVTDLGKIHWTAFAERRHGVFAVALKTEGRESDALLGVREEWGITPRIYLEKKDPQEFAEHLPPKPQHTVRQGVDVILNPMKYRGGHAVASQIVKMPNQTRVLYVAIAADDTRDPQQAAQNAADQAVERVQAAVAEGYASIAPRHQNWWHDHMQTSCLQLPDDPYWQQFWWMQLYKFASASAETSDLVIDTQGPWIWDSAWAGVWWNLNIQLSYFPTFSANKLCVGRSLINGVDRMYKAGVFRQNAGSSPGIMVGRSSTYEGHATWGDEYGNLPWVLHCYWKYWRYSGDDAIGRALFPMLRDSTDFLISKLEKDEQGILHMPPSRSPEYSETLEPDTNYALMSLKWSLDTLLAMDAELGFNDPKKTQWQDVLDHLVAFPADENGFRVDARQGFDKGHRHYSHLLAIYPYHTVNPDQGPEAQDLIRRSVDRWQDLKDGHVGYTYTGGCAMYATLGDGEKALQALDNLKRFIEFNTMYREGGGAVIETPLSGVESINYMLLQSWNGILRIFPAVPDRWQNVKFRDFRGEGAFLVSAERKNGVIESVRIKSEKGKLCKVINPWKEKKLTVMNQDGKSVNVTQDGSVFTFATEPGAVYSLAPETLPEPTAEKMPRYRGFNLLNKFIKGRNTGPFQEDDFKLISEWGFNFVRLPMDYRLWIVDGDWTKFNEREIQEIDQAIEFGKKYGIHVSLNFHRAPGFTVARPAEARDLWTDPEAQRVCAMHWAYFAKRYKGISNKYLSFNLVNEPAHVPSADYFKVAKLLIEAIRAEDPGRLIISDGLNYGKQVCEELIPLGVVHSTRGYEPFRLTHYKASWVPGSDTWPKPEWPQARDGGSDEEVKDLTWMREVYLKPWIELKNQNVGVMVGEWGAYNRTPHDLTLRWMEDCLREWEKAGIGWALWNLHGSFGVLNSDRRDVEYEDFRGAKLDRKMLDLLQKY